MGKRAFVFAAGEYKAGDIKLYKRIKYREDDLIICADGGYAALMYTNIVPDVVIGDFDSLRSDIPKGIKTVKFPQDKDKTDLELCIDYAVENGCDTIFMLGVLGGRTDHFLGAVFAMRYALEKGADSMILTADTRVHIVKDYVEVPREDFKYISLIPCTETVVGVTAEGLKYPLEDAELKQCSSLGISNEFYDNTVKITIKDGLLYVICTAE